MHVGRRFLTTVYQSVTLDYMSETDPTAPPPRPPPEVSETSEGNRGSSPPLPPQLPMPLAGSSPASGFAAATTGAMVGPDNVEYWLQKCSICFDNNYDFYFDGCRDQFCYSCFDRYVMLCLSCAFYEY